MHDVFFGNKMLSEFKTFITNAGIYSTPARGYESVAIDGRNGNLIFEKDKFDNVEHKYPLVIYEDFDRNFMVLKSFLLNRKGYERLTDTFYPDEYYLATFKQFEDIRQPYLNGDKGSCTLVFERKPQRFLKSGDNVITFTTSRGQILNPTNFKALPMIRVYGSGVLSINSVSIEIDTEEEYLDIDCELQEVLQSSGNLDVTLSNSKFPYLQSGTNSLMIIGNITEVRITPRWWRL